jgi:hypothetical protein
MGVSLQARAAAQLELDAGLLAELDVAGVPLRHWYLLRPPGPVRPAAAALLAFARTAWHAPGLSVSAVPEHRHAPSRPIHGGAPSTASSSKPVRSASRSRRRSSCRARSSDTGATRPLTAA